MTGPPAREPLAPLGVWLLGALALLTAWLLVAPLMLPGVVVLGGAVLLGSCCTQLGRLLLARYWSSAGPHDLGPAGAPPPVVDPAGGGAVTRVAWRCAYPSCRTQGWAVSDPGAYVAVELHTVTSHPGSVPAWDVVGASWVVGAP